MIRICTLMAFAGMTAVGQANAAIALATSGETLYRVDLSNGNVETFNLGDEIVSQMVTSTGDVLAFSNTKSGGQYEVYELTDPTGAAPSLNQIGSRSLEAFGHSEANGVMYAIRNGDLYTVDNSSYELTFVGDTGINGTGSTAFDTASGTFYALSSQTDSLYRIDGFDTASPSAALIGSAGVAFRNQGMEFFDGVLYAAMQNDAGTRMNIGTVDTATGLFTSLVEIETNGVAPTSLAVVVPTPGAISLLAVAGVAATRRRR